MKSRVLFFTVIAVTLVTAAAPAEAKKGIKKGGNMELVNGPRFLGRFDADHNGQLQSAEAQRLREVYQIIKKLDTDGDGQLSDSEIQAAKLAPPESGKHGGKKADL